MMQEMMSGGVGWGMGIAALLIVALLLLAVAALFKYVFLK
jgi:hypothetical protein